MNVKFLIGTKETNYKEVKPECKTEYTSTLNRRILQEISVQDWSLRQLYGFIDVANEV